MKEIKYLVIMGALVGLTGFGSHKEEAPKKQVINYSGEIVIGDRGRKLEVENISISGKLTRIKLYEKPASPSDDPNKNITYVNLDQIVSIEPARGEGCNSHRFKYREYHEIMVTLKGEDEPHLYLIDAAQKIRCDERTKAGLLDREIAFSGMKKLTITGKQERTYTQLCPQSCYENKKE